VASVAHVAGARAADGAGAESEVVARTPPYLWFTPASGWPEEWEKVVPGKDLTPTLLMPTAEETPFLFSNSKRLKPLGELRLEILEAEGLKGTDLLSLPDPYAAVLFEGYAARTNAFANTTSPRWHHTNSPRAFSFPVSAPYSCLYVAIKDCDDVGKAKLRMGKHCSLAAPAIPNALATSDDLGRVIIELAALTPGTEYDAWYPLQKNSISNRARKLGNVRLRFSLRVQSPRARILRYVTPPSPPEFIVPFTKKAHLRHTRFAYKGHEPPTHFSYRVLKAHLREVSDLLDAMIEGFIDAFEPILFWKGKAALHSLAVCLLWQWLVSNPRFIPASLPLLGLIFLQRSYNKRAAGSSRKAGRLTARPGAVELLKALLLNKPPQRLTAEPLAADPAPSSSERAVATEPLDAADPTLRANDATAAGTVSTAGDGDDSSDESDDESDDEGAALGAKPGAMIKSTALDLKLVKRFSTPKGSLAAKIKEIREEVEEEVGEMVSDVLDEAEEGQTNTRLGGAMNRVRKMSPLTMALGPVQTALGKLIIPLRTAERVLNWHDRVATLWLYLSLVATSLVLAVTPWTLVSRIVGFGVLGPHMHLVGRALDKRSLEAAKRERAFAAADASERAKILKFEKAEALAQAKKKLDKIQRKLDQRTKSVVAQDEFVSNAKYNLIIRPSRTQSRIRDRAEPDPARSRAYPAPEGW